MFSWQLNSLHAFIKSCQVTANSFACITITFLHGLFKHYMFLVHGVGQGPVIVTTIESVDQWELVLN